MMIDWLDEYEVPVFPDTSRAMADPNGLIAAGGHISPLWLDSAYRRGIFPWNDPQEARLWWTPSPRAVIVPESFHVPRRIAKECRNTPLRVTSNQAFAAVMEGCAGPRRDQAGTWIDDEILETYPALHACGRAVSIECWTPEGDLAGGFYGLLIGSALFGESMFSRVSGASRIAFACAAPVFFESGITMIDCQMRTEHLARFGLTELARPDFEQLLKKAVNAAPVRPLPGIIR